MYWYINKLQTNKVCSPKFGEYKNANSKAVCEMIKYSSLSLSLSHIIL